jgi:hypothetical protein
MPPIRVLHLDQSTHAKAAPPAPAKASPSSAAQLRSKIGNNGMRTLAGAAVAGAVAGVAEKQEKPVDKWTWDQSSGTLSRNGQVVGRGYAGHGAGKNNPAMQDSVKVGPIPAGLWRMVGVKDSPKTGPFTIVLEPEPGTNTLGRSEFRVHGDSRKAPGTASEGCIILDRATRDKLWQSRDKAPLIEVVE